MLNRIINSEISHNINEINRLNYLNKKNHIKKNKYSKKNIEPVKLFKGSKEINLIYSINDTEINDIVINKNIRQINNVFKLNFKNSPSRDRKSVV